jgi:hypothetical protein
LTTGFDPTHLLGPLEAIMAVVLIYSSRLTPGKAKETPEGLVFPLKPVYALSRMLFLPAYMAFFLWLAWRQNHLMPWPIIFLCLAAYALSLLQAPATITLTPMAVTQRFWLQPSKTILYGEIMTLQAMQAGRTILVLGDNRVRIRHSANHAAAADFRRELERRTGKHVIN